MTFFAVCSFVSRRLFCFQKNFYFFQKHLDKMPLPLGISEGSFPEAEENSSLFLENWISDLQVRYLYRRAITHLQGKVHCFFLGKKWYTLFYKFPLFVSLTGIPLVTRKVQKIPVLYSAKYTYFRYFCCFPVNEIRNLTFESCIVHHTSHTEKCGFFLFLGVFDNFWRSKVASIFLKIVFLLIFSLNSLKWGGTNQAKSALSGTRFLT